MQATKGEESYPVVKPADHKGQDSKILEGYDSGFYILGVTNIKIPTAISLDLR